MSAPRPWWKRRWNLECRQLDGWRYTAVSQRHAVWLMARQVRRWERS
jgi:hypothetical protein